jgi:hypothetical protein
MSAVGATGVVTSITNTLGNSFAMLSMDTEYQRSRKLAAAKHRSAVGRLAHGGESLLRGVYEGATGLILQPFRGTQVGWVGWWWWWWWWLSLFTPACWQLSGGRRAGLCQGPWQGRAGPAGQAGGRRH